MKLKFTCKQCAKVCKTEHSVKQHIGKVHKNDRGLKRTASSRMDTGKKKSQKLIQDDDIYTDSPLQSTQLGDTSTNIDNFDFEEEMELKDTIDGTFKLNETVEQFMAERKKSATDEFDDIDVEEISPDQDHAHLADGNVDNEVDNDVDLLKATNLSLKLELEKKDILLNENKNDLKAAQLELTEQLHVAQSLRDDFKNKDEALDTATAQINGLEEKKKVLENKLREYTEMLRTLIKEKDEKSDQPNEREKELANTVKEKNKVIKKSETAQKRLASKLAELENKVNENNTKEKYKKVNDQLSAKTKEAKKNNDDLKKAEKRAIELMDTVSGLNKKVSELENSNTRLRLMKDQAKEIIEKTDKARPKSTSDAITTNNKKKCKFENTGNCRNRECEDIHPKKTCQSSSKLGSCPLESSCEHRHPFGICFDWEKNGQCFRGDGCRNRHPLEMGAQRAPNAEPFLGQGSPSGAHREEEGRRAQPSQRSPGKTRHHDQRGLGRW